MIVQRNLRLGVIAHYTWKGVLYYFLLSVVVYLLHDYYAALHLHLPFSTLTALSTALAIFLGFKNSNAYDRWWEARQIWGQLVNSSRSWGRQVITMIIPTNEEEAAEVRELQERMVYRHMAFVHGLRVFLRIPKPYNENERQVEVYQEPNDYADTRSFLQPREFQVFCQKKNPPNFLLNVQGDDLRRAYERGWISDYRFVLLEQTLVEFNNVQGRSERIKNTPLPRQYSFFSRIFVFIHASILPSVFVDEIGIASIPVSVMISFVFLCLDLIGERTEDPFENRLEDVPLTELSLGIETVLKEHWGSKDYPAPRDQTKSVVL